MKSSFILLCIVFLDVEIVDSKLVFEEIPVQDFRGSEEGGIHTVSNSSFSGVRELSLAAIKAASVIGILRWSIAKSGIMKAVGQKLSSVKDWGNRKGKVCNTDTKSDYFISSIQDKFKKPKKKRRKREELEKEIEAKAELLEQKTIENSSLRKECSKLQKKVVNLKTEYETLYKIASQELENLRNEMILKIEREKEEEIGARIPLSRENNTNITLPSPLPSTGA